MSEGALAGICWQTMVSSLWTTRRRKGELRGYRDNLCLQQCALDRRALVFPMTSHYLYIILPSALNSVLQTLYLLQHRSPLISSNVFFCSFPASSPDCCHTCAILCAEWCECQAWATHLIWWAQQGSQCQSCACKCTVLTIANSRDKGNMKRGLVSQILRTFTWFCIPKHRWSCCSVHVLKQKSHFPPSSKWRSI